MNQEDISTGNITTRLYGWIAKSVNQDRCRDELLAINRLESQERAILKYETLLIAASGLINMGIGTTCEEIRALIARAESAEAELVEYRKRYVEETYPTA